MLSSNRQVYMLACAMFLFGLWSSRGTHEVPMKHAQNVQLEQATRATIDSFNGAFNRREADGLAALLSDDTVFEDTSPAPDGRRIEGKAVVVDFWREWFARNPDARFETEEVIVSGSRAVVRWVCHKVRNGEPWRLRGVDINCT
jgi:ketosteroid isomerase-like protein